VLRLVIADRWRTFAEVVAQRLDQEPGFVVVAVVTPGGPHWPVLANDGVDVTLVDARLAVELIRALPRKWARGRAPHIVALGDSSDAEIAADLVRLGISGWVGREEPVAGLIDSVRAVSRGEARIPSLLLARVLDELTSPQGHRSHGAGAGAQLTQREREILRLLEQGFDRSHIAAYLHLSPNTVRTHVRNILNRLDVHSTLAAVAKVRSESPSPLLQVAHVSSDGRPDV
jgi:DNA-binding NarL/FixJ family response regulator